MGSEDIMGSWDQFTPTPSCPENWHLVRVAGAAPPPHLFILLSLICRAKKKKLHLAFPSKK